MRLVWLLIVTVECVNHWGAQVLRVAVNGSFIIPIDDYSDIPVVIVSTPHHEKAFEVDVTDTSISVSSKKACLGSEANIYGEVGFLIVQQGVYVLPDGGKMFAKVVRASAQSTIVEFKHPPKYTGENFFADDSGIPRIFIQSYGSAQKSVQIYRNSAKTYSFVEDYSNQVGILAFTSDVDSVPLDQSSLLVGDTGVTDKLVSLKLPIKPQCGHPLLFTSVINGQNWKMLIEKEFDGSTGNYNIEGSLFPDGCPSNKGEASNESADLNYIVYEQNLCTFLSSSDTVNPGSEDPNIDQYWNIGGWFTAIIVIASLSALGGFTYLAYLKIMESRTAKPREPRRPGVAPPLSPVPPFTATAHVQPTGAMRPPGL